MMLPVSVCREGSGSENPFRDIIIIAIPFVDTIARAGGSSEIEDYFAATGVRVRG